MVDRLRVVVSAISGGVVSMDGGEVCLAVTGSSLSKVAKRFASNHIQRMMEPPQNLYAKNLRQPYGYPLWSPEPKPGLPSSYEEYGLQIGDVGYVDEFGMFEVQFNICFPLDHELHQASSRCEALTSLVGLTEFNLNDAPPIPDAFPQDRVICHGIRGFQGHSQR